MFVNVRWQTAVQRFLHWCNCNRYTRLAETKETKFHCVSYVDVALRFRPLDLLVDTGVSEEYTASCFRAKYEGSVFLQNDDIYLHADKALPRRGATSTCSCTAWDQLKLCKCEEKSGISRLLLKLKWISQLSFRWRRKGRVWESAQRSTCKPLPLPPPKAMSHSGHNNNKQKSVPCNSLLVQYPNPLSAYNIQKWLSKKENQP
jgi:hypothetical protein